MFYSFRMECRRWAFTRDSGWFSFLVFLPLAFVGIDGLTGWDLCPWGHVGMRVSNAPMPPGVPCLAGMRF